MYFYNLVLFYFNNIKYLNIYIGGIFDEINDFYDINNVEENIFKGLVFLRLFIGILSCL